jgi:hypothetical protein
MKELGFEQQAPTPLWMDNQSAINMINARVPTEHSRRTLDVAQLSVVRIGSEHRDSSNSSPSADVACDASAGTASFGCILW